MVEGRIGSVALRNIERARLELIELHQEFALLERRVESVCESVRKSVVELFARMRSPGFKRSLCELCFESALSLTD